MADGITLTPNTLIRTVRLKGMAKSRVTKKVFMAKPTDHGSGVSVTKCEDRILDEDTLLQYRECNSRPLDVLLGVCFVTVEQVVGIGLQAVADRDPEGAVCKEFAHHHHCLQDARHEHLCPDEDAADRLAQLATANGGFVDAAFKA